MVIRIIIAGETQCQAYAESCLLADYLSQNLPNFCYQRIEKKVIEWKDWLCKINTKYNWHHMESPIIWKEMVMKGSKPFYIGGASDFLDYCYSYYDFDSLFASDKYEGLLENVLQFKKQVRALEISLNLDEDNIAKEEPKSKSQFVITISGAGHSVATSLISGLLDHEITEGDTFIRKIYIYDERCSEEFMKSVEQECYYVQTNYPGRVVKYVDKVGMALTSTDLLIVLDHLPFEESRPLGEWLHNNKMMMQDLALKINASGSRKMYVLFANLGPACYNATILRNCVNINKNNIAVATMDVGLEILPIVAHMAEVPMRNIFCPPVWGFIGISELTDIRTTVHKYNTFEPYHRYSKVKNSTLPIGSLTPEMRTLDYLMHFDELLWMHAAIMKSKYAANQARINKVIAIVGMVNRWLLNPIPDHIVCAGISCNGSFGLNFDGIFSQPARIINGALVPATDFPMPKDFQMKLPYMVQMAELAMGLKPDDLPQVYEYCPCKCKTKIIKRH